MGAAESIALATHDPGYSEINRMESLHPDLPILLYLLGGSSINQEFYDTLDTYVLPGGTLSGQSKATPEEDVTDTEPQQMEYTRPNGDTYYVRDWNGMRDVAVLQACAEARQYVYMYGPPGTGKTALAEAAFGENLVTVVCSGDTTTLDLIGQWIPNPKFGEPGELEHIWADGPVVVAAENGWPLLLDEAGLVEPKVLSAIYGLLDGRREINVTMNPKRGIVKAKEGFFFIAASNPKAPGVNMSEALLSRMTVHVEVTTDWALALSKLNVPEQVVGIAQSLSKKLDAGEIDWAPQMRELLAFRDIKAVFGEKFAVQNLIATAPAESREDVQEAMRRFFGAVALPSRI